jgi:cytidylate kinase
MEEEKFVLAPIVPGPRAHRDESNGMFVTEWEMRGEVHWTAAGDEPSALPPCIAFSRKIGVGVREIAGHIQRNAARETRPRRKEVPMAANERISDYAPGVYPGRRSVRDDLIGMYVTEWEMREKARKTTERAEPSALPPCIAFSRKIGVGTQEIADRTAGNLRLRVADREVVEEIAKRSRIGEKAVSFFDERFPGYVNRTFRYLFGEKAFIDSDYARQLIHGVHAIAALGSTIFVGRGVHLILPRDRVLAVRCIGSDAYRENRVAEMMGIQPAEARKKLIEMDREQAGFFKRVFGKEDAPALEFDLVVNRDFLPDAAAVAEIVTLAFRRKFPEAGKTG